MGICCSCPCCNLCQCCTYCGFNRPSSKIDSKNPTWMKELAEKNPDIKVRELILPGTHDTGTYSISKFKCCSNIAITQTQSVYEQLCSGVRYIDIRLAGNGTKRESINIFHGPMMGTKYINILDQIAQFSKENPSEFVLIDLIFEYGKKLTDEQKNYIYEITIEKLGDRVVNQSHSGAFNISSMKIKDVVEHERSILLMVQHKLTNFKDKDGRTPNFSSNGFFPRNDKFVDQWHNTNNPDKLMEKNIKHLKDKSNIGYKFVNSQIVLTPQVSGCKGIMKLLVGCNPVRVDNLVSNLFKGNKIDYFLREHSKEKWNVMAFDFFDYNPYLNRYLIGLNYRNYKLRIIKAVIRGDGKLVEVTEDAKKILEMGRENSFFVIRFEKDFNLKEVGISSGYFTMVYEYFEEGKEGEKKSGICNFSFKKNTKFLLNMINIEEQGEIIDNGEAKGAINEDKHYKGISGGDQELVKLKDNRAGQTMVYTKKENGEVEFKLV